MMAEGNQLVFSEKFTSEELTQWLEQKLEGEKIELQPFKDHAITGETFLLLDLRFMVKSLGYIMSEATRILFALKSIIQCYEVKAKYCGALKTKGIRAAVYRHAEEHKAHYSLDGLKKSIWYNGESDDLLISVLFKKEKLAQNFCCFLGSWHLNNPVVVKSGDIAVEEKITSVVVEMKQLSRVLLSHYDAGDSESPIQSLMEFASCPSSAESAVSLTGYFSQLQRVEAMSAFNCCVPYRCHIKPKRFETLKNNENNELAATWSFHQYFDGLNTEDPMTGQFDLPLIALNPLEEIRDEMVGEPPIKRKRVEIEVEYRDPDITKSINLKEGSTKISDVKWKTFVHVEDHETLCTCLKWKYNDTLKKWKEADQFDQLAMDRD